ncbi:MAG TPA: hypothetical protein VNA04_12905 [Thermoanaerobaculia bacterium]|nr:hypothetical protein [Thermoanaerobaculia bacterium]
MEPRLIASARLDSDRVLVIAAAAGLLARLLLAFTSIGTNDVLLNLYFGTLAGKYSVLFAYGQADFMNHPPLSLLLMDWYLRIASYTGLEFPVVFRTVQSLADGVTAAAIVHLGRDSRSRAAAVAFLLCPAAIFISGFHCNTDPMMLTLLTLSILAARNDRFLLAGVLLGASFGIKIVALFAAPLIFLAAGRRRWDFAAGFLLLAMLIFAPSALAGGPAVLSNVLGYSGWRSAWGISGLAQWIYHRLGAGPDAAPWLAVSQIYSSYGTFVLGAGLLLFYWLFWRRLGAGAPAELLTRAVPVVYLIVLALAPRFGVQYLMWPLPLLPFVLPRALYLVTCLVFSGYLFAAYTIWSGGFPWWYADAMADHPLKWILTDSGFLVWAWIVTVAVIAIVHIHRRSFTGHTKYALD